MAAILAAARATSSRPRSSHPEDAAAVARWWESERQPERAAALYAEALPRLDGERDWEWAGRSLRAPPQARGKAARGGGDLARLWAGGDRAAAVEIAKYLEHEARDLAAAEEVAAALLGRTPAAERAAVIRRLERIRRKRTGLPGGRITRALERAAAGGETAEPP